jgi:hypothetical protein
MDNFNLRKFLAENKIKEGSLMNEQYTVSIRTEYGVLSGIEVSAENEQEAFNKAIEKAIEALYTSKIDQIEKY